MKPQTSATLPTPGPWLTDEDSIFILGPQAEMIAEMRGEGAQLPIEANARLIAASPEMLEALETISATIHDPNVTWETGLHESVKALIRKARGTE